MTTRSQKRKAVAELVSGDFETSITENFPPKTLVASSSKIPRIEPENLAEIKTSLRKEIMSDLTKILAENQKEMLKLIAPTVKKQTIITAAEETDSESENIPENATSTPIKNKTTATTRRITPVNSRNINYSDYEQICRQNMKSIYGKYLYRKCDINMPYILALCCTLCRTLTIWTLLLGSWGSLCIVNGNCGCCCW